MNKSRRALCLMLTAALLAVSIPLVAYPGPLYLYVGNTSSLNLRSGPGYEYAIIGNALRDQAVEVLGYENEGAWAHVRVQATGAYGYMDASFLFTEPLGTPANPGYPANARAMVKNPSPTGFLNLRAQPSYSAKVLGIYYNGTICNILSYFGGWYHVMMDNGLKGYFRGEFLFTFDPTTPAPSSPSQGTAQVTSSGGRVNLRQGPGYEYPVLSSYRPGTTVIVYSKGPGFWQIMVDGVTGFMDSRFLRATSGGGSPGAGGANATVKSGAVLNLRQQPSTSARILGKYASGTAVKVRRQGLEWCYVSVPSTGATGYFMTKYLRLVGLPEVPTKVVKHPWGSYVNLRGQPSTGGSVTLRVKHNSVVTVLAPMGDWTRVRFGSTAGFMMSSFLK